MSSCCVQGLRVDVSPRAPLLRLGQRHQLVCRVSGCPSAPVLSWSLLEDRPLTARVATNGTHSMLTFDPVLLEDEGALVCRASCGRESRQSKVLVQVYSFPSAPVIVAEAPPTVGAESQLICQVWGVHPAQLLSLTWLQGGAEVQGTPASGSDPVQSQYHFLPAGGDSGATISCRATLELQQLPADTRTREASMVLQPLSPPTNTSLQVSPGEEVLEGQEVTVTCSSDGPPLPSLLLRSEGAGILRSGPAPLSVTLLLNGSAHFYCLASNPLGAQQVSRAVRVAASPLKVSLSPAPPAPLGTPLVLTCRASGCSHPPTLTWRRLDQNQTLLQGTQPGGLGGPGEPGVSGDPGESGIGGPGGPGPEETVSLLTLEDVDLQDQGDYSCVAQCGPVVRTRTVQVQVFSFRSGPVLLDPGPASLGQELHLRCDLSGLVWANQVRIQWLVGGATLKTETSGVDGSAQQNLSSLLQLQVEQKQLLVTCRAALLHQDGAELLAWNSSLQLLVHYPPGGAALLLSPGEQVDEGQPISFNCRADGAPPPSLVLSREGAELERTGPCPSSSPTSLPSSPSSSFLSFHLSAALLADSAHYSCQATNQYGSQLVSSFLTVRAPPRETVVEVLPSREVQEGEDVTVLVRAVGWPPPTSHLRKVVGEGPQGAGLGLPDGSFLLRRVTAHHSGAYQVNVSNQLGYQLTAFSLRVRGASSSAPPLTAVLVPVVCSVAVLAAAALLVDHLRRSRKRGFYQLPHCSSHPQQQQRHQVAQSQVATVF
ncbi:vascular cell adhesion protein 1b isoform X2 [Nelusetta ayraudi]|uniref:vascular cell adhesion protein 1b isoform X2 n=1 Tax=Nelusetta ayraudi TaxID=303726 RepID=UPI003F71C19E